jgi:5-oxoprolinase (ATP-hydrolysing) subunit C
MGDAEGVVHTRGNGIFRWRGAPQYGRQDLGYTPGGVQDRFSLVVGNAVLENDPEEPALEVVQPPQAVFFTEECLFILTGGAIRAQLYLPEGSPQVIEHAVVYHAPAGSEIRMYRRRYGWRTYLCVRPGPGGDALRQLPGRRRGPFRDIARWPDRSGRIRLVEGPEYSRLKEPRKFFQNYWKTGTDMSDIGIRLEGSLTATVSDEQMISGPVCDGTIQLTPTGPIILMRDRQTVGGYPRICVVISADVDLLGQYGPGQRLRFVKVDTAEAREIARLRQKDIDRIVAGIRG